MSERPRGTSAPPEPDLPDAPPGAGRPWGGRRAGVRVLQIVATVAVTWFIVDRVGLTLQDVRELDADRWRPRWGPLAASSGGLLAGYGISAALWGRMVRELGGPRLEPATAVRTFLVANLGRYVPGKVWQIAGLALLARRHGVPASVATAAAVLGQGFALLGATLIGLAAFFRGPPEAGPWGIVAGSVALGLVILLAVPGFLRWMLDVWFRLARTPVPERLRLAPSFGVRWLALYSLNWTVYAGAFWGLARAFGLDVSIVVAGPAFAAAYVLGYAMIFAPAGIGVREGFLVAFLQPSLGAGPAGALAVIARLWTTVVEVGPAGAMAALRFRDGPEGEVDP